MQLPCIATTTTDPAGRYALNVPVIPAYDYYNIVEQDPAGYVSVGATTVGGVKIDNNWVQYVGLMGKTLIGNKFWDKRSQPPENQPPVVDAGPDQVYGTPEPVTLPHLVTLSGSATDDGLPAGELWTEWMLVSGPSEVEFENGHDLHTTVALPAYGTYVLRLTAGDGEYESSDDVQMEVKGETEPSGCLLAQDFDHNGRVDIRDLAIFASAWLEDRPECAAHAATEAQASQRQAVSVLVPVYMYYLERYFSDVPDKTDLDVQIKAILDESKAGREFLLAALVRYLDIPPESRQQMYDAETLGATSVAAESLNLDFVRERVGQLVPGLAYGIGGPPAAPTGLVATNTSVWDEEFPAYQITLTWQDNSNDEDGFRIYRVFKPVGGPPNITSKLQLIDSVASNVTTYTDKLSKPANASDQYCYQVVAYKVNLVTLVGQPPTIVESDPSNGACAYYDTSPPPPAADTDKDGVPDFLDDCPNFAGVLTHGCPDADLDGIPNIVEGPEVLSDMCPQKRANPRANTFPPTDTGVPSVTSCAG